MELRDIQIIDSLNFVVLERDSTFLKSTDGGNSWVRYTFREEPIRITKLNFLDHMNGFAGSLNGDILRTTDAGENWQTHSTGYNYGIVDIDFIDPCNGWIAIGTSFDDFSGLLYSSDSAKTWSIAAIDSSYFAFTALTFNNTQKGYASKTYIHDVYTRSEIYEVNNYTKSVSFYAELSHPIIHIAYNENSIWCGGVALYRIDENLEIERRYEFLYTIQSLKIFSQNIWLITKEGFTDPSALYRSNDSGGNWMKFDNPESSFLISCDNYTNSFVVTIDDSGNIYKNSLNATSISQDNDIVPSEFKLLGNYPNPFNPSTLIKYNVPATSNVRLTIYNMMGQEIRTIESNGISAGTQNFTWNGTNQNNEQVASGIYIYRLNAVGNDGRVFDKSAKMMFMK